VLYSVEFNDNGKTIEALTFDENLFTSATKFGENGTLVDAGVAPGKKDPSKWELVSLTPNEA
jgi:predicted cupin superfamily sugar epimerase